MKIITKENTIAGWYGQLHVHVYRSHCYQ